MQIRWLVMLLWGAVLAAPAGTYVQFRTVLGDIEVELLDRDKPKTVANFLRYVQSGAYDDLFINRCEPGFVIQAGGYKVIDRGTTNNYWWFVPRFDPIPNEYGAGQVYSNQFGTIAMAKVAGDTNSASAEWFFNLTDNDALDARDPNGFFTVFGQVVGGANVLRIFNTFSYTNTVTNRLYNFYWDFIAGGWPQSVAAAWTAVPFRYPAIDYTNFVYVDITLLQVQVQRLADESREVAWNSVAGRGNRIEFTTNLPPVWHTLWTTNGDGRQMKFIDTSSAAPRRFYRIKADETPGSGATVISPKGS